MAGRPGAQVLPQQAKKARRPYGFRAFFAGFADLFGSAVDSICFHKGRGKTYSVFSASLASGLRST